MAVVKAWVRHGVKGGGWVDFRGCGGRGESRGRDFCGVVVGSGMVHGVNGYGSGGSGAAGVADAPRVGRKAGACQGVDALLTIIWYSRDSQAREDVKSGERKCSPALRCLIYRVKFSKTRSLTNAPFLAHGSWRSYDVVALYERRWSFWHPVLPFICFAVTFSSLVPSICFCHESERNRYSPSPPSRHHHHPFRFSIRPPLPLSYLLLDVLPLLLATTTLSNLLPRRRAGVLHRRRPPSIRRPARVSSSASYTFMDLLER